MSRSRSRAALAALGLVLASGAAIALWNYRSAPGQTEPAPAPATDAAAPEPTHELAPATLPNPAVDSNETADTVAAHSTAEPLPPVVAAALQLPRADPSPASRQAVTALTQLDFTRAPVTQEQVDGWKAAYKQLTDLGPEAVPAIREFLDKNVDVSLETAVDGRITGFSTVRMALLEAMYRAGGPESIPGLLQALQTTAIPSEIATIANYLEQTESGTYREAALAAARQALTLASAPPKWEGGDVAPLFEVLTRFGGPTAAGELQAYAEKWFDYAPIALAKIPDGAGVPLLVQMAQGPLAAAAPGGDVAVRLLAEVAPQHPDAAETLLEQTRSKRIPDSVWPGISASLAGASLRYSASCLEQPLDPGQVHARAYHVEVGNQNFLETLPRTEMSPSEITDRLRLIDQLLGSTSSPAAIEALRSARTTLAGRSPQ